MNILVKDRLFIWIVFSGLLIVFGIINMIFNIIKNINTSKQFKTIQDIEIQEEGDIKNSINNVLDNDILQIIEEKDKLLKEKDKIISILQNQNNNFIKNTRNKITYIIQEKNKLLKNQETIIIQQQQSIKILEKDIQEILYKGSNKFEFIIQKKDEIIQEKNKLISFLKESKENNQNDEINTKKYHHKDNFINVNDY